MHSHLNYVVKCQDMLMKTHMKVAQTHVSYNLAVCVL